MLRAALSDFCAGVSDLLRGLLLVFKLRRRTSHQQPTSTTQTNGAGGDAAASSATDSPGAGRRPMTTLERRRQERARAEKRVSESGSTGSPPPRVVPSAIYRVCQCVFVNCLLIGCFQLATAVLSRLYGWSVDSADYKTVSLLMHYAAAVLSALWLLPLFTITRLVNCLWFQDIANAAAVHCGKQAVAQASFSRNVADLLLAVVLETVFLLQSHLVCLLPSPLLATVAVYLHLSLLYALYSFEYSWIAEGVELSARLRRIDEHWCYYLGFGLPLTLLTMWPSSVALSGCLFGMAFPFALLSSYQARQPPSAQLPRSERPPALHIFDLSARLCQRLALAVSQSARRRIVAHSRLVAQQAGQ